MNKLLNNPELQQYLVSYEAGQTLFLEGDDSKDLYLLVKGRLQILKNKKPFSEITTSGDLVGEMSHLLDIPRTATILAQGKAELLKIPAKVIDDFLKKYPQITPQIINNLARRLKETTQVAHGLKEFCDQLPDAVVMTGPDNSIQAWNKAAEILHGRTWQEMKGHQVGEVFQNPEEYRQFIDDVHAGKHLTEKVLCIRHPDGENCFVSTSTTILYDGHFNIAGYIFLSRNINKFKKLEEKYRASRNWLLPAFLTIGLLLSIILTQIPSFTEGVKILDHKKKSFQERITKDSSSLAQALAPLLAAGDRPAVDRLLANYIKTSSPTRFGIDGVLLLNQAKEVTSAYSPYPERDMSLILGSNYSGIQFQGSEENYKVLTLFRSDTDNPMGTEGIELAHSLPHHNGLSGGWLILQLKKEYLHREFGITPNNLMKIKFSQEAP